MSKIHPRQRTENAFQTFLLLIIIRRGTIVSRFEQFISETAVIISIRRVLVLEEHSTTTKNGHDETHPNHRRAERCDCWCFGRGRAALLYCLWNPCQVVFVFVVLTLVLTCFFQSPQKNLTAKEVRQKLQENHEGWKLPGERRVAKFIKRQISSGEKMKKKKSDGFFRMFKIKSSSKSTCSEGTDNLPLSESHPDSSVSSERKVGFRHSFAKALSPSRKSKKLKLKPKRSCVNSPEDDGPMISTLSDIEDCSTWGKMENEQEEDMEVKTVEQGIAATPEKTPSNGEKEIDTPATEQSATGQQYSTSPLAVRKLYPPPKELFVDAYADDNDGKRDNCECEGCIVM